MKDLNKYALVTGASSGIGWHISKELALKGYSIIGVSNQPTELNNLKLTLEKDFQINVHIINCDLASINAAEDIFNYCQQHKLNVEVLVNNAGILVYGAVVSIEFKQAESILQLHMNTPILLCKLFGAIMEKNRKGFILNVSSISAVMPYPTISLYGPTKTFLRQFTRALRTEMKGSGVYVSCLLPGATATSLYDDKKINFPLAIRLGVMKKPENVAKSGVKALFKNRAECIPGVLNKLVVMLVPLIPSALIGYIYKRTQL